MTGHRIDGLLARDVAAGADHLRRTAGRVAIFSLVVAGVARVALSFQLRGGAESSRVGREVSALNVTSGLCRLNVFT